MLGEQIPLPSSLVMHTLTHFAGDKSNHVPAFHVPQLYYLISCATAFCWPTLLRVPSLPSRVLRKMFGSKLRTTCTILLCAVVCLTINRYTCVIICLILSDSLWRIYLRC